MNVHFYECTPAKSRFATAAQAASGAAGRLPWPFPEWTFGIPRAWKNGPTQFRTAD